jgi:hypothetical protein
MISLLKEEGKMRYAYDISYAAFEYDLDYKEKGK